MTPEKRIQEGEGLIQRIISAKPQSWERFKALYAWGKWVREHGCAVIRFGRKQQRENAELLDLNKRLCAMVERLMRGKSVCVCGKKLEDA